MPNPYGYDHDTASDAKILELIKGGEHGTWEQKGDVKTFTPSMSFFDQVPVHDLASYFVEHLGDDLRLNLP
jgi:hypothetical protein